MEAVVMKSILPVWKTTPEILIKHLQAPTVNTELTSKMPNIGSEFVLVLISALKINAGSDWILFSAVNVSPTTQQSLWRAKSSSLTGMQVQINSRRLHTKATYYWCIAISTAVRAFPRSVLFCLLFCSKLTCFFFYLETASMKKKSPNF